MENSEALGGMRNPHESVYRLPGAAQAGRAIRRELEVSLASHSGFVDAVVDALRGQPMLEPSPDLLRDARARVCGLIGKEANEGTPGLCREVFQTYLELSGDPDCSLPEWLAHGAPLGINQQISRSGVFPPVEDRTVGQGYLESLVLGPQGWSNYRSSEDEPELTRELLDAMVDKSWAFKYDSWEDLERHLGTSEIVLNRLALISKVKADGSLKHRLVWDLRRSGVNLAIQPSERVVLPRLLDFVSDIRCLSGVSNEPVYLLGTDVSDAFHQVPLHRDEQAYTVASVAGVFYVFRVLVFGSGSAPTVWGRYAAFLGRSTAAVLEGHPLRLQVYVDDPVYAVSGTLASAARLLALALLWARVAGYPLAWMKTEGGESLRWIGAQVSVCESSVQVTIPLDKAQELRDVTRSFLASNICGIRKLRSYAGLVSFFAGLIPHLRPFLACIWAVLPAPTLHGSGGAPNFVYTKQIRPALLWLHAFFNLQVGSLSRTYPFAERHSSRFTIVTDASPWGIGGVLYLRGKPHSYFHDGLHECDLNRFRAKKGDPAFTTIWESLAILVALRIWRPLFSAFDAVSVRSDSHGSLSALSKMSSSTPLLNMLVGEIALDSATHDCAVTSLRHIPGVSNVTADALSRIDSPDPKPWPTELDRAHRVMNIPCRDETFYRTRSPPQH